MEENEKNKVKTEETTGRRSQAAASSSGGGSEEVQRSRGGVPREPTNKRKACEDQEEESEKKNTNEQEERGLKRSTGDWGEFAKELSAGAGRRAEEHKRAKVGEHLDNDAMMEATGAVGFAESDLKYDGAVEKFIDQLREETFDEFYDAISREVLDSELIKKTREAELESFKKYGVCQKVPLEECWSVTG